MQWNRMVDFNYYSRDCRADKSQIAHEIAREIGPLQNVTQCLIFCFEFAVK